MKSTHTIFVVLVFSCLEIGVQAARPATASEVSVIERGLHHRIVQNESGGTYTVLADGLCYDDNGVLKDSEEIFELEPGFAVARRGQHKATLAANINSERVVELIAPDGKRFVSRIAGLSYFSAATGENILIAQVQDSIGVLHPPNQIIYPAALVGDGVTADVRYTWRKGGFAQDVIIREIRPPDAYNLDPATARLQAWTFFLEAPEPQIEARALRTEDDQAKRQAMAEPDFNDQTLRFGALAISDGRAFELGQEGNSSIPVGKEWGKSETGDTYLIESLEYVSAKAALDALPVKEARANPPNNANVAARKLSRQQLMAALAKRSVRKSVGGQTMQMAKAAPSSMGFVLDYETVYGSYNNFTFAADRTYYISGLATLGGTTVLEPAVIKFSPYNPYYPAQIKISGTSAKIICLTTNHRPAILTASTDNTVGETVTSGTPSGYYAAYGIYFDSSAATPSILHNIRIRYANTGIYYSSGTGHILRHAQLVGCNIGLQGALGTKVQPQNVLLGAYTVLSGYLELRGENLTISAYSMGSSSVYLTNSLYTLTVPASPYGINNASVTSSAFAPAVGAGAKYLATDSPHRDVGTIEITPSLLADLRKRTTYAPIEVTENFSAPVIVEPTQIGDFDDQGVINDVDRGYHYDILDYVWSGRTLTSTLLLTNGVAIAHFGTRGTTLGNGAKFISEGSPFQHNVIVPYTAVQENASAWGASGSTFSMLGTSGTQPSEAPQIYLRFTDLSFPANINAKRHLLEHASGDLPASVSLRDCELSAVYLGVSNSATAITFGFTNNLIRRTLLSG